VSKCDYCKHSFEGDTMTRNGVVFHKTGENCYEDGRGGVIQIVEKMKVTKDGSVRIYSTTSGTGKTWAEIKELLEGY